MAENPELSPAVLEELRAALLGKQQRLRTEIDDLRQSEHPAAAGPVDEAEDALPGDDADASVDLQDEGDTSEVLSDLQAQLAEVNHALAKFATGTYGICERGGEPIPLARLRALPEARYDLRHQAEVEAGNGPR